MRRKNIHLPIIAILILLGPTMFGSSSAAPTIPTYDMPINAQLLVTCDEDLQSEQDETGLLVSCLPLPTATPTPEPTATNTPEPTATYTPTLEPTATATTPAQTTYFIAYSTQANRANSVPLEGATVSGKIYPFSKPNDNVETVHFYLDDVFVRTENNSPYDFGGGSSSSADSWNTTTVTDGQHTIRAELVFEDNSELSISSTFTVQNGQSATATPVPGEPTPTATATTPPQTGSLTLIPTFHSIGVYAPSDGTTSSIAVEYRQGDGAWQTGHPLMVDPETGEARGSLVGLQPNSQYEVRVADQTASISTRDETSPPSVGATRNVATAQEFQAALDAVNAGETIALAPGVYNGEFVLRRSGTQENYIRITGEGAILDGAGFSGSVLTLENADYIRVDTLEIRNAGRSLILGLGSDYLYVENTRLIEWARGITGDYGNIEGAIHLRNQAHHPVVRFNEIHRETPMTTKMSLSAFVTWKAGYGSIIYGNNISGGIEDGVRFSPEDSTSESESKDVDIYDNHIDGAYDDGLSPEGVGINVRVWGNTITNSYVGIALAPIIEGPTYIFRNIIYDNQHWSRGGNGIFKLGDEDAGRRGHKYIYHNTLVANAPVHEVTGYKQSNSGIGHIVARNNIVQTSRYIAEIGCDKTCDIDYDGAYTSDPTRFVEFRSKKYWSFSDWCSGTSDPLVSDVPQGCNSMEYDATGDFVDAANGDFTLISSSPLVNAGVFIPGFNDNYIGAAPDIGAFEQ